MNYQSCWLWPARFFVFLLANLTLSTRILLRVSGDLTRLTNPSQGLLLPVSIFFFQLRDSRRTALPEQEKIHDKSQHHRDSRD